MNSGAKIAEGTPEATLADKEVIRAYLGDEHA
jgi:ABC-type branched-subunit amino acid transport system ATPase component